MLAWRRALIPMSLALLVMSALIIYYFSSRRGTDVDGQRPHTAGWLLLGNVAVLALSMIMSVILPAAPETNRKMFVPGSRFRITPLPKGAVAKKIGAPVVAG